VAKLFSHLPRVTTWTRSDLGSHEHAAAVDSTDGLEHREVGLNENVLDARILASLGQDVIQPLKVFADYCAGDASLRANRLIRVFLIEGIDRNEQDVLMLVGEGCPFILRAQRRRG